MSSVLARRYASALLEVGKEQKLLDRFYDEFKEVIRQLNKEKKFEQLLSSPQITRGEKKEIFKEAFGKAMNSYFLNFLYILVDKGRQGYLKEIFTVFQDMVFEEKNILSAEVVSAIGLREEQLNALKKKLSDKFKKEIILKNKVDASIIGGLIVYAGDQVIDGSVKSKIARLKADLKEIRLQEIGVN